MSLRPPVSVGSGQVSLEKRQKLKFEAVHGGIWVMDIYSRSILNYRDRTLQKFS